MKGQAKFEKQKWTCSLVLPTSPITWSLLARPTPTKKWWERSFSPKNKWGPKVTAIEEARSLKKLKLDDLLGKLLTHEIHLKEGKEEGSTKGIALKAIKKIVVQMMKNPVTVMRKHFPWWYEVLTEWGKRKSSIKEYSIKDGLLLKEMKNPQKVSCLIRMMPMLALVMVLPCQVICCLPFNSKNWRKNKNSR